MAGKSKLKPFHIHAQGLGSRHRAIGGRRNASGMGNVPAGSADAAYRLRRGGLRVRSGGAVERQGRQDASEMGQDLLLGDDRSCGNGVDAFVHAADLLSRDGRDLQFLCILRSVSRSFPERDVQGRAPRGVGLGGRDHHGAVELPAFPAGLSQAEPDGRGSDSGGGTYGEHRFDRFWGNRDAAGAGFAGGLHQAADGEDVLVVWPYAGDDCELYRRHDSFLGGEFFALVWGGVVGVAMADDCGRAGDYHLDNVLQEEILAESEGSRVLNGEAHARRVPYLWPPIAVGTFRVCIENEWLVDRAASPPRNKNLLRVSLH